MLEGLEISEVRKSDLSLGDRVDAEYFQKENIRVERLLEDHLTKRVDEISSLSASAFYPAATHLYEIGDMPFLRCVDTVNYPIISHLQDESFIKVPENFARESKGINFLKKGDICLTKVGTPCFASVIHEHSEIAMSRTVMGLAKINGINPYYLMVFLRSHHGFNQLYREREQTIQFQLKLERVAAVDVFIPSKTLQQRIAHIAVESFEKLKESKALHQQAEQTLLAALGLEDWEPPNPLTYEAQAKDAFESARLDSEFFQPKIKQLYELLGEAGESIGAVSTLRKEHYKGSNDIFNYLEIGAVASDGTVGDSLIEGAEAPSRATWHVKAGDIVTSTVRPIRALTAIIEEHQDGAVASSGFAVLKPASISAELLLTYLKLPHICELMDLQTSASMYPAISVPDILSLPFKHPGKKAENTIINQVQEARQKRQHSKALLERAKRAVEIAIERNEETALAYLDGKHYVAEELIPKLFTPTRHYIDLATVQRTIEAEALTYEHSTINRYLSTWQKEGRIHDAGRGWYSDLANRFVPSKEAPPLAELGQHLRTHFPLLEHTLWSTRQLAGFFHHLPSKHATFLMVDRDAMESVAESLLDAEFHVITHPLGKDAQKFALRREDTIVIRPRLSSDHTEDFAPIEQILVDLFHENEKLSLMDDLEYGRIFRSVAGSYRLNISSLTRYAERRKMDSSHLLTLGGITSP